MPQEAAAKRAAGKYDRMYRTVAHMDNPDHREYRRVTAEWFMGPGVRKFEQPSRRWPRNRSTTSRPSAASRSTMRARWRTSFRSGVIMSILGVPREDQPLMLRLTQEFFGADDADLSGDGGRDGAEAGQRFDLLGQFFDYFTAMAADRRKVAARRPRHRDRLRPALRRADGRSGNRLRTTR